MVGRYALSGLVFAAAYIGFKMAATGSFYANELQGDLWFVLPLLTATGIAALMGWVRRRRERRSRTA